MPYFTEQQERIILIIPRMSGSVSLLCSFLVGYIILVDAKSKLQHIYQRLLLAVSISDMIASFNTVALSGWTVNYDFTCKLNRFLLQFNVVTALYTASLCWYFLLVICYQWTPRKFKERWWVEIILHGISVGWPVGIGVAGVVTQHHKRASLLPGFCSYHEYPEGRHEGAPHYPSAVYMKIAATVAPVGLASLVVLVSMLRIFCAVRKQESRSAAYQFQPQLQHVVGSGPLGPLARSKSNSDDSQQQPGVVRQSMRQSILRRLRQTVTTQRAKRKAFQRTNEAAKQSGLFVAAYYMTFTPTIAAMVIFSLKSPGEFDHLFVWSVFMTILSPCQGFWNLLVYVRPRYISLRKRDPQMSRFYILRSAIFQPANTNTNTRSSSNTRRTAISKARTSTTGLSQSTQQQHSKKYSQQYSSTSRFENVDEEHNTINDGSPNLNDQNSGIIDGEGYSEEEEEEESKQEVRHEDTFQTTSLKNNVMDIGRQSETSEDEIAPFDDADENFENVDCTNETQDSH